MQLIIDTLKNTGTLHHAYCIEGNRDDILKELHRFLEEDFQIKLFGNPDLWVRQYDTLTIDDSREIKEFHLSKSFDESSKKIFIISTNFITREAQNALLKIFEEPFSGNHFFIITPSSEIFMPTLRSRLMFSPFLSTLKINDNAKKFIKLAISERLAMTKLIVEKMDAIEFINGIERELVAKKDFRHIEEIIKFKNYLSDRAPSVKMILEHVALIV
ncbi:MAG: hypothetical protein NUV47_00515 [Patescibacteria group bacterium]|nr:hypothetical protein [Patescibacteria group bacterium]